MMWTCALCGEDSDDPITHARLFHEIDEGVEVWPDGAVVIHDSTLEPRDFS